MNYLAANLKRPYAAEAHAQPAGHLLFERDLSRNLKLCGQPLYELHQTIGTAGKKAIRPARRHQPLENLPNIFDRTAAVFVRNADDIRARRFEQRHRHEVFRPLDTEDRRYPDIHRRCQLRQRRQCRQPNATPKHHDIPPRRVEAEPLAERSENVKSIARTERRHGHRAGANRRADVVVYVNGLPLGVAELKNPGDGNATLDGAWNQLQTYKAQIPLLFRGNAALVISDGLAARIGSLTANRERFVVVIADEAHRSQYGFEARVERRTGEVSYGFARRLRDALPNASFIGFTGTPVETADVSTLAVFGDYTDVYDIGRAGGDGRAGAAADRPRAGAAGADQRHRRLDAARGGARQHPPGDAAVNQQ